MRRKFIRAVGVIACVSAAANALAAESYLCAVDAVTGFHSSDGNNWTQVAFEPKRKFVIARSKVPGYVWQVTETGDPFPSSACKEDFSGDSINCGGINEFRFNRATLKFTIVSQTDFWISDQTRKSLGMGSTRGGVVSLGIGRCTAL